MEWTRDVKQADLILTIKHQDSPRRWYFQLDKIKSRFETSAVSAWPGKDNWHKGPLKASDITTLHKHLREKGFTNFLELTTWINKLKEWSNEKT